MSQDDALEYDDQSMDQLMADTSGISLDPGSHLLTLPNELLIAILQLCTVDSLLSLLLTNRRLYTLAREQLSHYQKILDDHGLLFLSHQAGTSQTIQELQASLETRAQSWLTSNYKRQVLNLREARGSMDTFIFDAYMVCCKQNDGVRSLQLYSLDPANEDPVSDDAICTLQMNDIGPSHIECVDTNQDLVAFAHMRKPNDNGLRISLYSIRNMIPHPLAIEPVLTIPAHFIKDQLEAAFICGKSIVIFLRGTKDSIILVRWRGEPIFPAIFYLEETQMILHMLFLDEDHPLVLTSGRSARNADATAGAFDEIIDIPLKLRILELQPMNGNLSDALTAYSTSYFSEGPQFLFPPFKDNIFVEQDASWILPYHPPSYCVSQQVAKTFQPSPYSEPARHAGIFVIHLSGNAGNGNPNDDDEWQIQIVVLKSEILPWKNEPLIEVEWDAWGRDATRIFQPRLDVDVDPYTDTDNGNDMVFVDGKLAGKYSGPLRASFMTWVDSYRAASIAFERHTELQSFHVLDFNPNTVRRLKALKDIPSGYLVLEPWTLSAKEKSPFIVNIETCLPFYVVDFDLGEANHSVAEGEPCMVKLSANGLLFERDDPDTGDAQVGFCWIEDGIEAFHDKDKLDLEIT